MPFQRTRRTAVASVAVLGAFAAATAVAQTVNKPPIVAGTPSATGKVGTWYTFAPWARDPEGKPLTFRVQNAPSWAKVDVNAGRMKGYPQAGTYRNIIWSVSDGVNTVTLPTLTLVISPASTTPPPPPPPANGSLAERYPGDVGIAADSAVIFHDPYEDSSSSTLAGRYQTVQNPNAIAMVTDKHGKSRGARSMRLTSGASTDNAAVFRNFGTGYDEVYMRYYTKYSGTSYHHSGFWFGGYNPNTNWPNPRAGQKPVGNERFSLGLEPHTGDYMDLYTYWMNMKSWKANPVSGDYFGNMMLHKNSLRMRQNAWTCYEIHLKLNPNPANGLDSVLEVWENDQLVRRFDNTGPYGWNLKDKFCPADSDSRNCTDFAPANRSQNLLNTQWRNSTALKINHIWPQNYNSTGVNSSVFFDDLVVAKSRVGCMK